MRAKMMVGATLFGAALAAISPTAAADLTARSTIRSVTVFPQGAEIERVATVRIEAGDHVVILQDLPAGLLGDSVRVEGTSTGAMEIGAVDIRQFMLSELSDPAAVENTRRKLQDELDQLNDQRLGLQAAISAAEQQKRLMQNLTNLPSRPSPAGSTSADPDWAQLFTLIGERLVLADKTIVATTAEVRALDKKIADLQFKLNQQPANDQGRTELKVRIAAKSAGDADFVIHYQVEAAGWQPIYEARLTTGDGSQALSLSLARNAAIYQSTGEAWTNVGLSLSTTRPQAGTAAPELVSLAVDFELPPAPKPQVLMKRKLSAPQSDAEAMQDQLGEENMVAAAPIVTAAPEPVAIQQASIANAAFQAVYGIPGAQTIESGVGNKRVRIDTPTITPSLAWRTTPKLDPAAYLYAKWTVAADLLLLPGPVALFRDGTYVGQGTLPQLASGESHELGFGRDDKVIVTYVDLGRKAGQSGLISTSKTDSQSFKATIKNLHKQPVNLRLLDQIPVSANAEIKVQLASDATPATAKDIDDKPGVLAWDLALAPDQEQSVAIAYQVSWPNGKAVIYQPR